MRAFVSDEAVEPPAGYEGLQKARFGHTHRELCDLVSQRAGAALFRARAFDHLPVCAP